MKILITGASGFIGSRILAVLADGWGENELFALVRQIPVDAAPFVNWVQTDFGIPNWTDRLPNQDFDLVIHLAQSNHYRQFPDRALDIFNINVKATVELAEWATKHKARRFLFASTGNVYGPDVSENHETDSCSPDTMYGASKLSGEILLKPFSAFMTVLILRFFCVYGPGQINAMLPTVIQRYIAGDEIILAGGVGVIFNPIYIDDCTRAIVLFSSSSISSEYEVFNVGGSEIVDLRQIVTFLEASTGKKGIIKLTPDRPKHLVGSVAKMREQLQFNGSVDFREGLDRTFKYLTAEKGNLQ